MHELVVFETIKVSVLEVSREHQFGESMDVLDDERLSVISPMENLHVLGNLKITTYTFRIWLVFLMNVEHSSSSKGSSKF